MGHLIETLVAATLGGALGGYCGARFVLWRERHRYEKWLDRHGYVGDDNGE